MSRFSANHPQASRTSAAASSTQPDKLSRADLKSSSASSSLQSLGTATALSSGGSGSIPWSTA